MSVIAILFILHTGCRPSEACYVVLNKTIVDNDYYVPHKNYVFKITAPAIITKTKIDYFWLLDDKKEPLM